MKKITKVILHNFKSHKHSEIPFDNFTAIIGPTNSGKSTIIKGIILCLYNEPSGDRYITHGEKLCYVEVQFDDGTKIKRTRGKEGTKEINQYDLYSADGTVQTYTNFGSGPFNVVEAFHGMPKVDLFGSTESLNVCDQFSAPFFLTAKPSQRAAMIGKLAKTDVVDMAAIQLNNQIRKRKAEKKEAEQKLKSVKKELNDLSFLPNAVLSLEAMNKEFALAESKREKIQRILKLKTSIDDTTNKIEQLKEVLLCSPQIEQAKNLIEQLSALVTKRKQLQRIQNQLISAIEEKQEAEQIMNSVQLEELNELYQQAENVLTMEKNLTQISVLARKLKSSIKQYQSSCILTDQEETIDWLGEQIKECKAKEEALQKIVELKTKISGLRSRIEHGAVVISELEKEYQGEVEDYRKLLIANKRCPVCNSEISENTKIDYAKFE